MAQNRSERRFRETGRERREEAMQITYTPRGVCSREFQIQVEEGVIQSVRVVGGCHGNLQGLGALLRGMKGIRCGGKPTSGPDQMAQALKTALVT